MAADLVVEDELRAWLAAQPAIAAIVEDRIYPSVAPQSAGYPRITYARTSSRRIRSLKGPSSNLSVALVQVDCWALTYKQSKQLSAAVRGNSDGGALDGFSGLMGDIQVQYASVDDDADDVEEPVHGDEATVYRVRMDVRLWFQES